MMQLQPPQTTDLITQLNQRVTALESAQYDDNSTVDMFRLFTETPLATDAFTISTHGYHLCGPTTICSPTLTI